MEVVLVLFTLILTVHSETKSADQKNADSSTLEKFLHPLRHDTNSRYGVKEQYLSNEGILRKLAGLSYGDGNNAMELIRADDRLLGEFRGEQNGEVLRNLGLQSSNNIYLNPQDRQRNVDYVEYGKNQDWLRNLATLYDLNEGYNVGSDDLLRYSGGQSYNDGFRQYGRNQGRSRYLYDQLLRNISLEPDQIGYVGLLLKEHKGGYNNFASIGSYQLAFDGRTYYGLRSPMTPEILEVAGRRNLKGYRKYGNYLH